MATRLRDSHDNHNVKNKENIPHAPSPSPSDPPPQRRALRPSLVKSPDKQAQFFTESFLANNTSHSSLIPSPLPSSPNPALAKPRRTSRPAQHQRPKHRQTRSELPATRPGSLNLHSKPLARGTSPIRSSGLSTPPRSRENSFTSSPHDLPSSPPPALAETYERIDQEEDLAATEGEISDPESDFELKEDAPPAKVHVLPQVPSAESLGHSQRSGARTPTNDWPMSHRQARAKQNLTTQSVLSDPTGMSFVEQVSDAGLRNALTPHFQQKALDREALDRVWRHKKPIAFGKAGQVLLDPEDVAQSVSTSPRLQPGRVPAFTKAARIVLSSDFQHQHQRTSSDVTDHLDHPTQDQSHHLHKDHWHNDDLRRDAMPHNPRLHRQPYFSRNHGFPERAIETQDDHPQANGTSEPLRKARSESPLVAQANVLQPLSSTRHNSKSRQAIFANGNASEGDLTQDTRPLTKSSLDIWAQEAADRPVRSIEQDLQPGAQRRFSIQSSPEKSRRMDVDFTGTSFQVSESPPVRTKSAAPDFQRDREIRGLARQAVTTSRLSQLRARDSQENLRRATRSPVSEAGDRPVIEEHANDNPPSGDTASTRRTASRDSADRGRSSPVVGPSPDQSTSHEILQRLARGSSSTPRSSTPLERTVNRSGDENGKQTASKTTHDQAIRSFETSDNEVERRSDDARVKATPKVTGAWTDTILPDTVKTMKRNTIPSRYTQTPHVSAGGWIDTPAPKGGPVRLDPVLEVTPEIPEELMDGIVKDSGSDRIVLADEHGKAVPPNSRAQSGESLARKVLNEAKVRDIMELIDSTAQTNADDSLLLGNTTIQSLENVLDQDETDMTIRSQLGQSDTEVLDRLGTKLDRLRTHIHDARKGLSNLEHRMSHPEDEVEDVTTATTSPAARKTTLFPWASFTFSVYIPMLFRPPKAGQRLPRPTPLGWIVLGAWSWYLTECTLAEIYSHPLYADRYTWPPRPEPEFPFVLPTMLWRWSQMEFFQPWIVRPIQSVFVALFRLLSMWLGYSDGYSAGPAGPMTNIQDAVLDQGQVMGFDMMNDEML